MLTDEDHPHLVLTLLDTSDTEAKAEAGAALYHYNIEKTGVADRRPIGATLTDRQSGKVLGGLWGRTELGLLFLDMFFLPPHLRGQAQGERLLSAIEAEALKRGCKRAVVETSSFQAPGFYKRHGYEEFGRVDFGLPSHARIFLRKSLDVLSCIENWALPYSACCFGLYVEDGCGRWWISFDGDLPRVVSAAFCAASHP